VIYFFFSEKFLHRTWTLSLAWILLVKNGRNSMQNYEAKTTDGKNRETPELSKTP